MSNWFEEEKDMLPLGKMEIKIQSIDLEMTKGGPDKPQQEFIRIKGKSRSGDTAFPALYFHSEGAIKMAAAQLHKLNLTGSLPIYASVADAYADRDAFLRKSFDLLQQLVGKVIEINVSENKANPKFRNIMITDYKDVPNEAIQKTIPSQRPKSEPAFDKDEILPF